MFFDDNTCLLCPNECGVDRRNTFGRCQCGAEIVAARAGLHFFEEPCVSGVNGSGTVFFSGCHMRCTYCQNHLISRPPVGKKLSELKSDKDGRGNNVRTPVGKELSVHGLIRIFKALEEQKAHNINLVSPTHFSHKIYEALSLYRPNIPVIYNTNGYEKMSVIARMKEVVDVYLTDYKYADKGAAAELSACPNYPDTADSAIAEMIKTKGKPTFDKDGTILSGVIIRHLVIPSYLQNSLDALTRIAKYKDDAIISIMNQYTPLAELNLPEKINRKLKPIEYKIVLKKAEELGIDHAYIQEEDACGKEFIPAFDFSGLF
ncbi:MAG: radical SAM protein [Clostridiales bacterium]|jgi:putative pyruvate formate lyase activating enzyme|nr:radical SAM protein [Clostridiales bacterium]